MKTLLTIFTLVFTVMFSSTSFANDHLTNQSNIDTLLNGIGMKEKVELIKSSAPSQIVSFFRKVKPDMGETSYKKLFNLVEDQILKEIPSLYKIIGSVYEDHFTKEELAKIIDFLSVL